MKIVSTLVGGLILNFAVSRVALAVWPEQRALEKSEDRQSVVEKLERDE